MSSEYRDLNVFDDVVVEVYRDGRIKTKDLTNRKRADGAFDNRKGRFLKPGLDVYGYHKIVLTRNGTRKCIAVHRLVALAWIDNPDDKPTVNHIDGNKTNNCVDNLEWATHKEQKRHSISVGLAAKNEEALRLANERRARSIVFDGVTYKSIREAARESGYSRTFIKKRGVFI